MRRLEDEDGEDGQDVRRVLSHLVKGGHELVKTLPEQDLLCLFS